MGTRRRHDYNTDIDTLFTIQNHQRTYTSLLSLSGMSMMENSGKSGIIRFLWGLFCRTAPCMSPSTMNGVEVLQTIRNQRFRGGRLVPITTTVNGSDSGSLSRTERFTPNRSPSDPQQFSRAEIWGNWWSCPLIPVRETKPNDF
ncbi:hypothetical protein AOLI_G00300790 [Acnodon oligacanthus]